jgi:hypothetical protein
MPRRLTRQLVILNHGQLSCPPPTPPPFPLRPSPAQAAFYTSTLGNINWVPYWSPPPDRVSHLTPARPQHARDYAFGGVRGAAVFVGQRASVGSPVNLLAVYALVNLASLVGVSMTSDVKPGLCEAAVDRGIPLEACDVAGGGTTLRQPASGPPLAAGALDVTYGVGLLSMAGGGRCELQEAHETQMSMRGACMRTLPARTAANFTHMRMCDRTPSTARTPARI